MLSYLKRNLSPLGLAWIHIGAICSVISFVLTRDPIGSIFVSTLIIAQGLLGSVVVRSIHPSGESSSELLLLSLGPGLAVGSLFSTLIFVFLNVPGLLLACTAALFVLWQPRGKTKTCNNQERKFYESVWLIASTMLVQYSSWSIYIKFLVLMCLAVLVLEAWNSLPIPIVKLIRFGAVTLVLVTILVLPRFWWAISDDFPYFMNVVKGLEYFGPKDSLGQAGVGLLNWHWLTFGWMASLKPSVMGDAWTQSLVVAPMIAGASSLSSLTLVLSRALRVAPRNALIGSVLASLCIGSAVASVSFRISLCWLFAALYFVLDGRTQMRLPRYTLVALLTIGLIAGKPSSLLLLGAVPLIALISPRHTRQNVKNALVSLLIVTATSLIYFLLFFRQSTAASNFWIAPLAHVSNQILIDNHPRLSVIIGFVITTAVIVETSYVARSLNIQAQQVLLAGAVCFAIPFLLLEGWSDTVDYFLLPALSALGSAIVVLAIHEYKLKEEFAFPIFTVATGASLGILMKLTSIPKLGLNGSIQRPAWTAITLAFFAYSWIIWNKNSDNKRYRFFKRCSVLLASATITIGAVPSRSEIVDQVFAKRSRAEVERQIGSTEVEALGTWIHNNLPLASIFVTNYFCSGSIKCAGATWIKYQLDFIRSNPEFADEGCRYCDPRTLLGGADFTLSAYSNRRFVLLGPRFQAGLGIPPIEIQQKILMSVNSVSSWSQQSTSKSNIVHPDYLVAYLPFVENLETVKLLKSSSIFQTKDFVVVNWSNQ